MASSQSSVIWNYFTKISTGKDNPVAASCNTCNDSMQSDPENKRLSNHLRVNHKPLHNEFEDVMKSLGKSPSSSARRGLSVVDENVPAAPKISALRNFRFSQKKVKEGDGKGKLKNLFEALLKQARKADGQPAENNTAGIIENAVGQSINNLINGAIDTNTFHEDLQKVLNSQPQSTLVPFINENLPPLKTSLQSGELSIAGLNEFKASKPVMATKPSIEDRPTLPPPQPGFAMILLKNA